MTIRRSLARGASRGVVTVGVATLILFAVAGVASAHVTAHSPDQPAKGGDAEITFRVPNESDSAGTVKLEVDFPLATPIPDADLKPVPDWTAQVNTTTLQKPVNMGNFTVENPVQSITWTARPGAKINPGEFQEFTIAVEGLPTNTDTLVMPATQTYDNGDVVKWDQPPPAPGQAEPEHPAPSLTLAAPGTGAAPGTTAAAPAADTAARWLGGIGIALGALALGITVGLLLRRRTSGGNTPA